MDWFAQNAAALTGLGGLATVFAAVVAVATLMRAGLDSVSRSRPYIVVEYRVPEFAYKRMTLVVRNAGPTAARNVEVEFDPPFVEKDGHGRLSGYVARRYARPISVLGPGQELASVVGADPDDEELSDIPETLEVRVKYEAPWWHRDYRDKFTLQRLVYAEQVFTESSASVRGRMKTITDLLKKIENHQGKWVRSMSSISNSIDNAALLVADLKPGVHWRVRNRSGGRFVLENIGDATAHNVVLTLVEGIRAFDGDTESAEVPPSGGIDFWAEDSWGSSQTKVHVSWSGAEEASVVHEWEGSVGG